KLGARARDVAVNAGQSKPRICSRKLAGFVDGSIVVQSNDMAVIVTVIRETKPSRPEVTPLVTDNRHKATIVVDGVNESGVLANNGAFVVLLLPEISWNGYCWNDIIRND
ncbi:hypothetical protein MC885_003833, partial [Smutsia gigantea]